MIIGDIKGDAKTLDYSCHASSGVLRILAELSLVERAQVITRSYPIVAYKYDPSGSKDPNDRALGPKYD